MRKHQLVLLLALVLVALPGFAQFATVTRGAAPTCNGSPQLNFDQTNGVLYACGDTYTAHQVAVLDSPQTFSYTTGSAAPATARTVIGNITANYAGSVNTSGSLVGVRGAATIAAGTTLAGQSYVYGTQGKLIVAGTINGSDWTAGVEGQLDISAATLTAGSHITPGWFDFGATGPSATVAFLDGIVLTNTTATTGNAMFYGYGKFGYFADLSANGSGFVVGTAKGSGWTKSLKIKVEGTDYFIPLNPAAS